MWIGLLFGCATHPHSYIIAGIVVFLTFISAFILVCTVAQIPGDKAWYMSYDELQELIKKERASWEKANKICKIIGDHEAVKLWEEKHKESINTSV